jgi:hypothetical protein
MRFARLPLCIPQSAFSEVFQPLSLNCVHQILNDGGGNPIRRVIEIKHPFPHSHLRMFPEVHLAVLRLVR